LCYKIFEKRYFVPETSSTAPIDAHRPEGGEEILRSLRRILRAVDQHGRRLAQQHRLTGPQLICLREIRRQGGVNPGSLARSVSLSPATVTGIIDRLEMRGLVTRERRSRDKRQVLVQLTDAGADLLWRTPPPLQERFVERLEALDDDERASLAAALERVVELMDAADIDAAPLLATGSPTASHAPAAGNDEPAPGAARGPDPSAGS
jgi:DNA-binding MarR family transcriptional regulator